METLSAFNFSVLANSPRAIKQFFEKWAFQYTWTGAKFSELCSSLRHILDLNNENSDMIFYHYIEILNMNCKKPFHRSITKK